MANIKNSQNLNRRIKDYYLGKLSLFDMGIVYLDEQLYSAAASYFMAAARKSMTDKDKSTCIAYCAYSYYMQLEDDSSKWQKDTVEELCKQSIVKDRDNYMAVMILISLYDKENKKDSLYFREYALKYCEIPNAHEKANLYKECIDISKKFNKVENSEFYNNMSKFIEENIQMVPKQLICDLYMNMYLDTNSEFAIKRYIETSESDIVKLVELAFKNNTNKTYCEITRSDSPITLSKILEDNGYFGSTISNKTIEKWKSIRKNTNLGLDKWAIEYDEYFSNFKNGNGIAGLLIIESFDKLNEALPTISFKECGFEYAIIENSLCNALMDTDFFDAYNKATIDEDRTIYKGYSLYEKRK